MKEVSIMLHQLVTTMNSNTIYLCYINTINIFIFIGNTAFTNTIFWEATWKKIQLSKKVYRKLKKLIFFT